VPSGGSGDTNYGSVPDIWVSRPNDQIRHINPQQYCRRIIVNEVMQEEGK
jgi:hypothetical protein